LIFGPTSADHRPDRGRSSSQRHSGRIAVLLPDLQLRLSLKNSRIQGNRRFPLFHVWKLGYLLNHLCSGRGGRERQPSRSLGEMLSCGCSRTGPRRARGAGRHQEGAGGRLGCGFSKRGTPHKRRQAVPEAHHCPAVISQKGRPSRQEPRARLGLWPQ